MNDTTPQTPRGRPKTSDGTPRMQIVLPRAAREALVTLARRGRRTLNAQACMVIEEHLRRAGLLPPEED